MNQELKTFLDVSKVLVTATTCILIFFYVIHFFVSEGNAYVPTNAHDGSDVAERTAPEGNVRIAGMADADTGDEPAPEETTAASPAVAATEQSPGQRVYNSLCFTCHGSESGSGGLPNIPHIGDAAAWADRIAQGSALLYERAINGFTGASGIPMPAKGGNPNLTDDEVRAAVDFMVENSQ